ncbi:MAG: amidohydrolase family protein [Anaerolineae bacterium]|nr:amidohydrolase family protein [Anaerolineae bacterium]NIO00269.1 amidohydrolase family protein [Anaerolineae bacterium]NIQ83048.1 amidohydrolase family protein [Anaerolineae bacterium]
MRTLIRDVTAITLDKEDRILRDVDIVFEGNSIVAVGKAPPDFVPDEMVDGREMVALPAFLSGHTHAAMTLERGWAEDLPFERWLNDKIWVAEAALQEEDVYWGVALACCEMIAAGTMGFADHYFWMDEAARAVEESGMKALLAWCHFGIGAEHEPGHKTFEETVAFVEHWNGAAEGRIRTTMGPHSPYMDPPEVLRRFVDEAHRLGVGAHLHLSESQEQMEQSLAVHNMSPVAYVDSLGLLDLPEATVVAHCNVVTADDLQLLSEKGTWVAHTPKTYQKLAMEMPPLAKMLERDVNVALGTDGPASSSDLNMLEVMRITGLVQKEAQKDPEAMPRTLLLRLATQAPAAAMGFQGSGILAPGHPADLILMDTSGPHWIPRHDLPAGVVYASHPSDVAYVWADGRLLYRQGEYLTLDVERIRWEAERRAFRMVGRPMRSMREYPSQN